MATAGGGAAIDDVASIQKRTREFRLSSENEMFDFVSIVDAATMRRRQMR